MVDRRLATIKNLQPRSVVKRHYRVLEDEYRQLHNEFRIQQLTLEINHEK